MKIDRIISYIQWKKKENEWAKQHEHPKFNLFQPYTLCIYVKNKLNYHFSLERI